MSYRATTLVVAGLVAIAALSASLSAELKPEPSAVARFLCHAAFAQRVLNSAPESLGTIRAFYLEPGGPRITPKSKVEALRKRRFTSFHFTPTETIGWCWLRSGPATYKAYAVAPRHKPVFMEGIGGIPRVPRPGPEPLI